MCTGIRLGCENGYVAGRAAEFGQLLEYEVLFLPVRTALASPLASGSGRSWTSTRAVVGTATFGAGNPKPQTTIDGIQELFHVLYAFDIPMGAAMAGGVSDFTLMTVARDAHELTDAWKTKGDQRLS